MSRKKLSSECEEQHFTSFETSLGRCAVAWSDYGLRVFQLPERTDNETLDRVLTFCPEAKQDKTIPPWVAKLIKKAQKHLAGDCQDFSDVPLDLDGLPPFHQRVYRALRTVPSGCTVSYVDLALMSGSPNASRAVGQAMARNPLPIVVPCHRVLSASGSLGGFSAFGGGKTKTFLLKQEGALDDKMEVLD